MLLTVEHCSVTISCWLEENGEQCTFSVFQSYSLFLLIVSLPYHNFATAHSVESETKLMLTFFILAAEGDSYATQSPPEQTNSRNGTVASSNATVMITSATSTFLLVAMLVGVYICFRKQKKKSTHKGLNIFPHKLPVVAVLLSANSII